MRDLRDPLQICLRICALATIAGCASQDVTGLAKSPPAPEPPPIDTGRAATTHSEVAFEPVQQLLLEPGLASTRDQYNSSYAHADFQQEPNAFLIQMLNQIAKMRELDQRNPQFMPDPDPTALEIAMGNGRNAIPLAQHGYRTLAFDLSDVGVNQARKKAAELGLVDRLHAITADAYAFDYGREKWNVVVMMYFRMAWDHLPKVKDSVKPGGYIIVEFQDINTTNETLAQFMDWTIVHYEHDHLPRDWGPGAKHSPGMLLRLVARKPELTTDAETATPNR